MHIDDTGMAPNAALYWIVLFVVIIGMQAIWPSSGHWLETHPVTVGGVMIGGAWAAVWIPSRLRRRRTTSADEPPTGAHGPTL